MRIIRPELGKTNPLSLYVKKIRKGKLTRRDFFKLGLGGAVLISGACKNTPTGPEPPEPPVPVTLQFEVYNHTEGYITSFTRNIMSGQNVNIRIRDIGVNDVDTERIVVREKNMGPLANFSRTGEANFTAPSQNMSYDVFLMNKSNGTNYQLIDNWVDQSEGKLLHPRNATTYRKDEGGFTGPQEAIDDVINQFNQAINLSWISYGKINQTTGSGNIAMGYGPCIFQGVPVGGMHSRDEIWVNPDVCRDTGRNIIGVFIVELFEVLTDTSDIHGDGSHVNGQDRYLTTEGKELLAYVFLKDERTQ